MMVEMSVEHAFYLRQRGAHHRARLIPHRSDNSQIISAMPTSRYRFGICERIDDLSLAENLGLPADSVSRDVPFNRVENRQHI